MKTHYLLRGASKESKMIYLKISLCSKATVISTGSTVNPAIWNEKKERVKDNFDRSNVNAKLNSIEFAVNNFYAEENAKFHNPSLKDISNFALEYIHPERKKVNKEETLIDFIQLYIDNLSKRTSLNSGEKLTQPTINKFKHFKKVFEEFCIEQKKIYDFDDIDFNFCTDFTSFLQNKKLALNTIGSYINRMKTMLNEATALGLNTNVKYKDSRFKAHSEDSVNIYLSTDELKLLEELELTGTQDIVRTIFLIGCWTGLRYSDFSVLSKKNIVKEDDGEYIHVIQKKTGQPVCIPLHPYKKVLSTVEKLPRIAEQTMNRHIKLICKEAGINAPVLTKITKGGKREVKFKEKWELAKTHTARRSFITNSYLQTHNAYALMKISGHKSESSFMKYLKVSDKEAAKILSEKLNW
ncbi:MAG: site-specific integrase [Bacteroidales bacterium]|nr:site-specific integrase [Bacteroidales bacterium]